MAQAGADAGPVALCLMCRLFALGDQPERSLFWRWVHLIVWAQSSLSACCVLPRTQALRGALAFREEAVVEPLLPCLIETVFLRFQSRPLTLNDFAADCARVCFRCSLPLFASVAAPCRHRSLTL